MAKSTQKKIRFHYTLLVDGEELENTFGKEPVEYVVGQKGFLPSIVREICGLSSGDRKRVMLFPRDGYGPRDHSKVQEVPKTTMPDGTDPKPGDVIELLQKSTGKKIPAIVDEVREKTMVLDFNHPLAGKDLEFYIEVVEVIKEV